MKLFEVTMNPINLGLWLSPNGDYIKVGSNHANDIIENPSKFGVTSEFVAQLYKKHNESYSQEGNAREELIKLVLQRQWVRIRNYRNYWSVTVEKLTPKIKENIRNWVATFVENDIMGKFADLKILEVGRDKLKTFEANDILKYALEEGYKNMNSHRTIHETSFDALPDVELLTEVKLSRVYNIFHNPEFAVGIITAFRADIDRTLEMNVRDNKALAADLRNAGFGYSWIDGAWIENQGTDSERHAAEVSILVTSDEKHQHKLFKMLKDAAVKYNQDAFVFQKANSEGSENKPEPIKLYDKGGSVLETFDNVRLDKIATFYSRLRSGNHAGRGFVFESERQSVGYMGRLAGKTD